MEGGFVYLKDTETWEKGLNFNWPYLQSSVLENQKKKNQIQRIFYFHPIALDPKILGAFFKTQEKHLEIILNKKLNVKKKKRLNVIQQPFFFLLPYPY